MYYEKSIYITFGSVSAAIINLVLNYFFIKTYGYKAAGFTTLFSYILLALFHYLMYKKVCKNNNIKDNIFDTKIMIIITILLLVLSLAIILLYSNTILRYLFAALILIITGMNYSKIINIIKMFKKEKKKEKSS